MKAITIYQPSASAIALRFKRYETRSWATSYRGPILIHAAKKWTREERRFQAVAVHSLRAAFGVDDERVQAFEENPPLGAVVAVADLVECHPIAAERILSRSMESFFGDFTPGRFAWQLENVIKTAPIECRGAQGLWDPPAEVVDRVSDVMKGGLTHWIDRDGMRT